jgi:uncharacterized protein (TIGR00369 family)
MPNPPLDPPSEPSPAPKASAPADPGVTERVAASFARQAVMATLGARLESVAHGRVVIALAHRADLTQQHGFLHAGVVATALDSACGYAAFTLMPADAAVLTIEFKINLLAPARGPRLRFVGEVVKAGRTISVAEGRAQQQASDDADWQDVATMTATLMTVRDRGLSG